MDEVTKYFDKWQVHERRNKEMHLVLVPGRIAGVGHREGFAAVHAIFKGRRPDYDRAHRVVLQHIQLVDLWVDKHKSLIDKRFNDTGRRRTRGDVTREHNSTFTSWFKKELLLVHQGKSPNSADHKLIFILSHCPSLNVRTYQAYDINGYSFYTEEKDKNSEYQNSGGHDAILRR